LSYSKFVIISHLRSGTHLLRTMLESHPAIVCQSEVFNSDDPNLPFPLTLSSREILDGWVFRKSEPAIECAGFVLQVYHPMGLRAFPGIRENPNWLDVWDLLENTPDLKVIHLKRENLLRRHLSHLMARQTGAWHQWDEERVEAVTHLHPPVYASQAVENRSMIRLDADRLQLDFEDIERLHERARERFRSRAYFPLSYESLCADPGTQAVQLQDFLGVEQKSLHAAVKKIEQRRLADSIANYRELKRQFSETRWAVFFDEAETESGDQENSS